MGIALTNLLGPLNENISVEMISAPFNKPLSELIEDSMNVNISYVHSLINARAH